MLGWELIRFEKSCPIGRGCSSRNTQCQPHEPSQYPVHLWDHRIPERGHAHSPQSTVQRLLCRIEPELFPLRPDLHSGTVLPLLWLCARYSGGTVHGTRCLSRMSIFNRSPRYTRSSRSGPPPFMACRQCSLRCSTIRNLRNAILRHSERHHCGSPLSHRTHAPRHSPMHARELTIAYGLTEASPVITQTTVSDPIELRVQTVGRPSGVEVAIIDPRTGAILGDHQSGELCTRGHGVMLGYFNMPEATHGGIDPLGWLHSGDLAARLPNGYYHITGRLKDMICRGERTFTPGKLRNFCTPTPPFLTSPWWEFPMRNTVKRPLPDPVASRDVSHG